jgi:hypothetical protein
MTRPRLPLSSRRMAEGKADQAEGKADQYVWSVLAARRLRTSAERSAKLNGTRDGRPASSSCPPASQKPRTMFVSVKPSAQDDADLSVYGHVRRLPACGTLPHHLRAPEACTVAAGCTSVAHARRMAMSAAASATVATVRARSATSSAFARSEVVIGSTDPSCRVTVPVTRATRRRTSRTRVER